MSTRVSPTFTVHNTNPNTLTTIFPETRAKTGLTAAGMHSCSFAVPAGGGRDTSVLCTYRIPITIVGTHHSVKDRQKSDQKFWNASCFVT